MRTAIPSYCLPFCRKRAVAFPPVRSVCLVVAKIMNKLIRSKLFSYASLAKKNYLAITTIMHIFATNETKSSTNNRLRQLTEGGRNDGLSSSYGRNNSVRGWGRASSLQARIAKHVDKYCNNKYRCIIKINRL